MADPTKPAPDAIDGYSPVDARERNDAQSKQALAEEVSRKQEGARFDGGASLDGVDMDGFVNALTGIGSLAYDKTLGGHHNGPPFVLQYITGFEAEQRARGSDLGGRIVEAVPNEMTRQGWDLQIQPTKDGEDDAQPGKPSLVSMDAAMHNPRAAALQWRRVAARSGSRWALEQAERWDAFAAAQPARPGGAGAAPSMGAGVAPPAAPPPPPGPLPKLNDEGIELVEAIEDRCKDLDVLGAINLALKYERNFGGAGILIGADDGETDLTQPLNEENIRTIRHLTPYFGGWDGEIIAWRWYNDPRKPKFGTPEVYMLRNLGVPIARPPAPGETKPMAYTVPQGPTGPLIFYIHESRFLVFPGYPVSRRARVEMRGWGDSIFMRVNEVLAQYNQTWSGISILMQEFSVATLKIDGFAESVVSKDRAKQGLVAQRARMLQLSQSIARMRLIDKSEEFDRVTASVAGVAELMNQFALRLAAAADMPVSMLMGQVKGGLGDAGNTDLRFFYDKIGAMQRQRMMPQLERLYRLLFLAKDSPTHGVEPERWTLVPRPLWQMTEQEQAALRKTQAEVDVAYIQQQVLTPEEVAASRFGGSEYSTDTVLDVEGRMKQAEQDLQRRATQKLAANALAQKKPPTSGGAPPAAGAAPQAPENASPIGTTSPAQPVTIPPMRAAPADPITQDPAGVPSTVGNTAKRDPLRPTTTEGDK